MSSSSAVNEGMSISDILRGMMRRRMLIVVPPLLGIALGSVFLVANKPRYIAEAQVIIENQFTSFDKTVGPQDANSSGWQVSDHVVTSQVSAMKSEDIAARVVDQLSLDTNPEYNENLRSQGVLTKLSVALGFKDDPTLFTPKALAAKTLAADLTIYPIPDSNVVGVKSTSSEPASAAAAANAIAETFVLTTREVGATGTDRAREWLSKQIDALRTKVTESEQAAERYRAEAGLIRGASTTLGTQQISELNTQIGIAENARIEAQAKVDAIQRMLKARGDVNAAAEVLASPSLQRLKDEQVAAGREISQVSATYLPNHPKMIAAQRHLDAVKNQIRIEAQRVVDSLQGQAQVAEERATALRVQLEKLKGNQAQANFSDVRLQALQREAAANRTLLQSMLSRYADANARQDTSLQPGYARVIQKAVAPASPYFPKKGPTLTLAAISGLLLGLGLAFIMEILAQPPMVASVRRRSEGEPPTERVSAPKPSVNVEIPKFSEVAPPVSDAPQPGVASAEFKSQVPGREIFCVVPAALTSVAASAMLDSAVSGIPSRLAAQSSIIANCLAQFANDKGMKTFVCTTIGSQAPNSAMVSLATARALAAKGKRVMLVDLTGRATSAEFLMGLSAAPGLSDLVTGKADFTKSVTRDLHSKLHFVRLGEVADASQEDAIISRLPSIITALRMVYDIIVFNIGEARPSVVQVLANADATLILASQTRMAEAAEAAQAVEQVGSTKVLLLRLDLEPAAGIPAKATA